MQNGYATTSELSLSPSHARVVFSHTVEICSSRSFDVCRFREIVMTCSLGSTCI